MKRESRLTLGALAALSLLAVGCTSAAKTRIAMDSDDIAGVVSGPRGPEAGVWVIAETTELPTKMAKIVVTDEQGRYVLPDLPQAKYRVWVRGYGLVDSKPMEASPGKPLDLTAAPAPDARAAAEYYPANYWFSLLEAPLESAFAGVAHQPQTITPSTQQQWVHWITEKCRLCHQLGSKATREIPKANGEFDTSTEAWYHRITLGVMGDWMVREAAKVGPTGMQALADWTDRIAAGALPAEVPPRPSGVERNLVVTLWDWADGAFIHDEIATDKRSPTVNAGGRVYGVSTDPCCGDDVSDKMTWFDPRDNTVGERLMPSTDPKVRPSPHNPMMDGQGRVWMTSAFRAPEKNPRFCTDPSNPSAKFFPMPYPAGTPRQLVVYDPKTDKMTMVETCSGTHHLTFGKDDSLYLTGDIKVAAWLDTRIYDKTADAGAALGWCPLVLDTNGDGRIGEWIDTKYTGPQTPPFDSKKDRRIEGFLYGLGVSPADESVWYAVVSYGADEQPPIPGGLVRMQRGSRPPETCKVEFFEPPVKDGKALAFSPRGVDVDSEGVAWVGFAAGRIGRFDRRQCKVLSGPTATGQHCPEGWTFYDSPGPKLKNVTEGSADHHYLSWVDLHDTLGLGKDAPIIPGSNSDSLLAVDPKSGKITVLRVPYPLGFYARGLDGRIDDARAGWKGRGLWSTYAEVALNHIEGGRGAHAKVVKMQLRPDPLAK